MFLGRNFIVTVRHGYATSFSQVRTRAESTPELLKQGPAFVLYAIIDFIVDQYFPSWTRSAKSSSHSSSVCSRSHSAGARRRRSTS